MTEMFKVVIFFAAVICMTTADYLQGLKEIGEVLPDIVKGTPETLKIIFDNGASVNMGNELTPTQVKNQPTTIDWNAEKGAYYTIIVTVPDAPFPEDDFLREVILWMVVNIPGKDISSADTLFEYIGAAPPKGVQKNRFLTLLFKQPGKIQFDEKPLDKYTLQGRAFFSTKKFTEKYNLGNPVAVNYYRAGHDDYVRVIYHQLNCCSQYL